MKINVCGCALIDNLFTRIDLSAPEVRCFLSKKDGDGGIAPGKLVFAEDLEKFAAMPYDRIMERISGGRAADAVNLGGPAIVAAINAAQILNGTGAEFHYYGAGGNDAAGKKLREIAGKTPLLMDHYVTSAGSTPVTDVLSDPGANGGKGERSFVNRIGAAGFLTPEFLGESFFDADILWYAATALTPGIHDA